MLVKDSLISFSHDLDPSLVILAGQSGQGYQPEKMHYLDGSETELDQAVSLSYLILYLVTEAKARHKNKLNRIHSL